MVDIETKGMGPTGFRAVIEYISSRYMYGHCLKTSELHMNWILELGHFDL